MAKALEKMSLEELQAHQREIEAAIRGYEKKRRADALAELREVAQRHGFTLDDLVGGKPAKAAPARGGAAKGVARYANPADRSQTWTGRGRQPGWVKEALAQGKDLESLAI